MRIGRDSSQIDFRLLSRALASRAYHYCELARSSFTVRNRANMRMRAYERSLSCTREKRSTKAPIYRRRNSIGVRAPDGGGTKLLNPSYRRCFAQRSSFYYDRSLVPLLRIGA